MGSRPPFAPLPPREPLGFLAWYALGQVLFCGGPEYQGLHLFPRMKNLLTILPLSHLFPSIPRRLGPFSEVAIGFPSPENKIQVVRRAEGDSVPPGSKALWSTHFTVAVHPSGRYSSPFPQGIESPRSLAVTNLRRYFRPAVRCPRVTVGPLQNAPFRAFPPLEYLSGCWWGPPFLSAACRLSSLTPMSGSLNVDRSFEAFCFLFALLRPFALFSFSGLAAVAFAAVLPEITSSAGGILRRGELCLLLVGNPLLLSSSS